MPVTGHLTLETVNFANPAEVDEFLDQMMEEGMRRVRAESAELRARGLMDAEGNMLLTELPPDMREGSGLDFGG